MHSHDLDLIAAYADGSLEGGPDEARRLVDTCAECRAEYRMHRDVREILRSAPPVSLTGDERLRVRTAVFDELGSGADVVDLAARRTRRWVAIGTAAAALLVIVGLGGALGQLQGGDSDEIATATAESGDVAGDGADTQMMVQPPDATTTTAPTFESAPVADLGPVTIPELQEAIERAIAEAERAAPEERRVLTDEAGTEGCLDRLADPAVDSIRATLDGDPVVVYVTQTDDGLAAEGFRVDGCVPLNLD